MGIDVIHAFFDDYPLDNCRLLRREINMKTYDEAWKWYEEQYLKSFESESYEDDYDEDECFTVKNRTRAIRIRKANEDRTRRSWRMARTARMKSKSIKRTKRELRLGRHRFDVTVNNVTIN